MRSASPTLDPASAHLVRAAARRTGAEQEPCSNTRVYCLDGALRAGRILAVQPSVAAGDAEDLGTLRRAWQRAKHAVGHVKVRSVGQ